MGGTVVGGGLRNPAPPLMTDVKLALVVSAALTAEQTSLGQARKLPELKRVIRMGHKNFTHVKVFDLMCNSPLLGR